MILAGDVGGTKTALAVFEEDGEKLRRVREATFQSREHPTLEALLAKFLAARHGEDIRIACLGVAGPIIDGRCQTTNLPWSVDEDTLSRLLHARVKLINDLEATAFGTLFLAPDDVVVLDPGSPVPDGGGNVAVVAAGTGLGEAFLYWDGQRHHPVACEGGHTDFAARSQDEFALLQHLRGLYGEHVSYERVVSGPGLHQLYLFLRQRDGSVEPSWLSARIAADDPSAAITEAGLSGADTLCAATLNLFSSLYGAEAGNLALKCMALGGLFVAGGIAPKILPVLRNGSFLSAFWQKGRFESLMRRIPVRVILDEQTALSGAAHFALRV